MNIRRKFTIFLFFLIGFSISVADISARETPYIYWTDSQTVKIQRANLDGSHVQDLLTSAQGLGDPHGLALDVVGGKMYWADWNTAKIQRANLNGSNVQDLLTEVYATAIALDVAGGKMYWTDTGTDKIHRANLDGSNIQDLVTQGLAAPNGISLDVVGGKMYWVEGSTRKIQRANLDGSNIQDLVTPSQGLIIPGSLALDVGSGKMYWTDWQTDKIQRANLDGSNIQDLVTFTRGLANPGGIALDVAGGKMYWTDNQTDKIQRANLDGSNVQDLVTQGLANPRDIAISVQAISPTINIPDRNLRAKIEEALGKASGAAITTADMATLTALDAPNANISNLTGLEYATNLTRLDLWGNSISDISALSGLTNLTGLTLDDNNISDISALSGLTNLTGLTLGDNNISDISAVSGLTNLTTLWLRSNNISDVSPLSDLTQLRRLSLSGTPIADLSPLARLTRLTTLKLWRSSLTDISFLADLTQLSRLEISGNSISDVSPLANLTKLTWLQIERNNISDLSPLVSNTGLGNGDKIDVTGNPLNAASMNTHIPTLQSRGVEVQFDTQERPIVRLIYFLPNDRQPQPDINAKMDTLIKDVQTFFADEIERHGFGRKTFLFEDDNSGQAIVHHVQGGFNEAYYHEDPLKAWGEISSKFDLSKDIYFTMLEVGSWVREDGATVCIPGTGLVSSRTPSTAGGVMLPAFGDCFGEPGVYFAAHEIGHACGLPHDFRGPAYLMSYEAGNKKLSRCAAEWLTAHRAFNPARATGNTSPTFKMLPPEFVSAPYTIRLRFEVTDPDGLHQVQLRADISAGFSLIGCQGLNGKTHATVEIDTTHLTQTSTFVYLQTMDVHGNFGWEQRFPIDLTALRPATVNIPDPNLRAAIEKALGKTSGAAITTADMATLTTLDAQNANISNLTGLEHATNLTELSLDDNNISDILPLVSNTGLGTGDKVNVRSNSLNTVSINTHIPTLQGRGVEVQFDASAPPLKGDVNGDGVVNIQDLVLAARRLGQRGQNDADMNGDGVVNIQDLVLVAGAFGNTAGTGLAPAVHPQVLTMLTAADVKGWLNEAEQLGLTTPDHRRGIAVLEQLLSVLTPKETALLPNYPNPFNPETWIPYHLAEAADVQVTIYDIQGTEVRLLELGYQPAGYYTDRSKAVYWEGRNQFGESVASGVYFYTLTVRSETRSDNFTATRQMLILK